MEHFPTAPPINIKLIHILFVCSYASFSLVICQNSCKFVAIIKTCYCNFLDMQ
jgi:hypothetical protein